jgi:hypothetical protein
MANNFVMVKELLNAGANPSIESNSGETARSISTSLLEKLRNEPESCIDVVDPRSVEKQIRKLQENQIIIAE